MRTTDPQTLKVELVSENGAARPSEKTSEQNLDPESRRRSGSFPVSSGGSADSAALCCLPPSLPAALSGLFHNLSCARAFVLKGLQFFFGSSLWPNGLQVQPSNQTSAVSQISLISAFRLSWQQMHRLLSVRMQN